MSGPTDAFPDAFDEEILDRLRRLHQQLDGPPAGFDEQVLFALGLADLDAELARLQDDQLVGAGARASERTRTISFDAPSLTILLTVVELPDGGVRIDGWLAPPTPAPLQVELRLSGRTPDSRTTEADESGRFVFDAVSHGLVQVLVHHGADDTAATVVTPSFVL